MADTFVPLSVAGRSVLIVPIAAAGSGALHLFDARHTRQPAYRDEVLEVRVELTFAAIAQIPPGVGFVVNT